MPGACGLRPCARTHQKKALCHTFTFGGAWNKYRSNCCNTALLQWLGRTSAGSAGCGTDLAVCVSAAGDFLRPQGAVPPDFYLLDRWVYGLDPEVPLIRGIPTEPKVFLAMLSACGLRPCGRTHQKRPCATLACSMGRATDTAAAVISTLPVFVYVETLLRDLDTFVWHLISSC